MIRTIHIAKYVLAESGLLLRNAAIHVCDPGRISRIEPWHGPPPNLVARVVDWGSALILPGLVNAHTHLELTRLAKPAASPASFTSWLTALMNGRHEWNHGDFLDSTREGARLSLASGTTLLGDISASGVSAEALKGAPLRKVVFEEVTSFLPERASEIVSTLKMRLERIQPDALLSFGASPHAPYSVSSGLYQMVADLARQRGLLTATHVAETRSELEFLKSGHGELRDFLTSLESLPYRWAPPGIAPIPYLDGLGVLDRPILLVHCNYLDDDSMMRILSRRCSVVYCPRSHAYFGHEPHPVRRLLDMGINVALGTDALTSNDSLSMLDEMRFLFHNRKDLKCDEIVRMATLNGAVALDYGNVLGRLRRGYWADMTVLRLPEALADRNVVMQILEGAGESLGTIVQGEVVWTSMPDFKQHCP